MKLIFLVQQNILCCCSHDQNTCFFYKNPTLQETLAALPALPVTHLQSSKYLISCRNLYWFYFLYFLGVKSNKRFPLWVRKENYYFLEVDCDNPPRLFRLKRNLRRNWLEISITCWMPQSWTKGWRQIDEIKQNRFFYGMFYSWLFAILYQKTSKFGSWLDRWVLAIRSKHFSDFLEVS